MEIAQRTRFETAQREVRNRHNDLARLFICFLRFCFSSDSIRVRRRLERHLAISHRRLFFRHALNIRAQLTDQSNKLQLTRSTYGGCRA
jgi:hypothetical protein